MTTGLAVLAISATQAFAGVQEPCGAYHEVIFKDGADREAPKTVTSVLVGDGEFSVDGGATWGTVERVLDRCLLDNDHALTILVPSSASADDLRTIFTYARKRGVDPHVAVGQ